MESSLRATIARFNGHSAIKRYTVEEGIDFLFERAARLDREVKERGCGPDDSLSRSAEIDFANSALADELRKEGKIEEAKKVLRTAGILVRN